jgi:hypothetical protein
MMKKSMSFLAVAGMGVGMFALTASPANAFHGNLVTCTASAGIAIPVSLKPGLTCTPTLNKVAIKIGPATGNALNNCAANPLAPWNAWAANKVMKITAGDAASVSHLGLNIKATAFSICDLASGGATTYQPSGAAKFQLYSDAIGTKVAGGGGAAYAAVGAAGAAAALRGIVTKGFGVGAAIQTVVGIDLGDPLNGPIAACVLATCPAYAGTPATTLNLKTDGVSQVRIDVPSNDDCTGAGTPILCCTGVGTGTC